MVSGCRYWGNPNSTKLAEVDSDGFVGVQSGLLLDHRFTIIKHTNDHFQLVQGYMAHPADDGGAVDSHRLGDEARAAPNGAERANPRGRFSTPGFTSGAGSGGFGLMGWRLRSIL